MATKKIDALDDLENELSSTQISKQTFELKPITKKKLITKLIPFFIVSGLVVICFALFFILPSVIGMQNAERISMYAFAPIFLLLLSPVIFYMFSKQYSKYNLKHNESMKKLLSKLFVKQLSQNGCFELRRIYLENPIQYAWDLKGVKIVENYAKWNPKAYQNDVKYYQEHQFHQ